MKLGATYWYQIFYTNLLYKWYTYYLSNISRVGYILFELSNAILWGLIFFKEIRATITWVRINLTVEVMG